MIKLNLHTDKANPIEMSFIHQLCRDRAKTFTILGATYFVSDFQSVQSPWSAAKKFSLELRSYRKVFIPKNAFIGADLHVLIPERYRTDKEEKLLSWAHTQLKTGNRKELKFMGASYHAAVVTYDPAIDHFWGPRGHEPMVVDQTASIVLKRVG